MKMIALILSISLLSLTTYAQVQPQALESHHQELIKNAAIEQCGMTRGYVEIVQSTATAVKVDQGVTDYKYETIVAVNQRVDQLMYDTYLVKIASSYIEQYDHQSKNWGVYRIEGASTCTQQ